MLPIRDVIGETLLLIKKNRAMEGASFNLSRKIFINCPINECIFDKKCDADEIICFTNDKREPIDLSNNFYKENNYNYGSTNCQLTQEANFFEYLIYIIKTLFNKLSIIENENTVAIKNSVNTSLTEQTIDLKYWTYVVKTASEREYLIKLGELQGEKLTTMLLSSNISNNNNDETIIKENENKENENIIIKENENIIIKENINETIENINETKENINETIENIKENINEKITY